MTVVGLLGIKNNGIELNVWWLRLQVLNYWRSSIIFAPLLPGTRWESPPVSLLRDNKSTCLLSLGHLRKRLTSGSSHSHVRHRRVKISCMVPLAQGLLSLWSLYQASQQVLSQALQVRFLGYRQAVRCNKASFVAMGCLARPPYASFSLPFSFTSSSSSTSSC